MSPENVYWLLVKRRGENADKNFKSVKSEVDDS